MALTLLAAMPAFGGEPVRLPDTALDRVTAGWLPGDSGSSLGALLGIPVPGVPAVADPDDDIWDLLGSGVVGQGGLLERVRGFLQNAALRPAR
ncbi:MAG: hypothetical protein R3D25_22995 [Geminicoccaceae bacterium]